MTQAKLQLSACALAILATSGPMRPSAATGPGPAAPRSSPVPTPAAMAAKGSTNAPLFPKSVFVFDPKTSRDPFFPAWRPLGSVAAPTNLPAAPVAPVLELSLKGISGSGGNRIALINNRPMIAGEETDFKTADGKTVRVRCAEITDQSAVVIVSGSERRTLVLGK